MFWFVPYISDPVWNFTYVAYSLTSSKPAKTPRDGASDTPYLIIAFSHNYIVNSLWITVMTLPLVGPLLDNKNSYSYTTL
jgi:hypothetical protein